MKIPNISLAILGFVHLGKGVSGHVLPQTHDLLKRDNRYLDNATDIQVIIDLSDSGWCMKYSDGLSGQQSLASCEIYCSNTHGDNAVDWECASGNSTTHIYDDEDGNPWTIGTCDCLVTTQNVTAYSLTFANATRAAQDLTEWGYVFTDDDARGPEDPYRMWAFHLPVENDAQIEMGVFGTKRDGSAPGVLYIEESWVVNDKRQNKPHLSDQQVSFWTLTPLRRAASALETIRYLMVIERSLTVLTPKVYGNMGKRIGVETLLVRRDGEEEGEQESFQMLATGCSFCRAAQFMIDDYEEFGQRKIDAFQFSWDLGGLNFDVIFDQADT